MKLGFEKWHGCRNDFIVCWVSHNDAKYLLPSLQRQATELCSRDGAGVGADGILVLQYQDKAQFWPDTLSIINSDGSLARNCGNGLRCAFSSMYQGHLEERPGDDRPESLSLKVEGREFTGQFLQGASAGQNPLVAVDMGVPELNQEHSWHDKAEKVMKDLSSEPCFEYLKNAEWFSCDLGNPHLVIFHKNPERQLMLSLGKALQNTPEWDGINVHLAGQVTWQGQDQQAAEKSLGSRVGDLYEVFVWERGVGETNACGSGACAVAASVLSEGFSDRDEWLGVRMPGGPVYVRQTEAGESIVLAGPAEMVFRGSLDI